MLTVEVPWPLVIFPPAGAVQLYVIPATEVTEYVLVSPGQTFAVPPVTVITPGFVGMVPPPMLTANVRAVLVPHPLDAVTAIFPPALPTVTLIVLVVDVPDQPEGNVHV